MRIVLLILFFITSPAFANSDNFPTANDLERSCHELIGAGNHVNSFNIGYCIGIIKGVIDSSNSYQEYMKLHYKFSPTLCVPKDWTCDEGAKVFIKWAKAHPERLHEPAVIGVFASHLEAFPCFRK